MPKRRQQYRRPPRPTSMRFEGPSEESLDLAASRLAERVTIDELRVLVRQNRELRDTADRLAQERPGPEALRRFREAVLHLAEAERALGLVETKFGIPAD